MSLPLFAFFLSFFLSFSIVLSIVCSLFLSVFLCFPPWFTDDFHSDFCESLFALSFFFSICFAYRSLSLMAYSHSVPFSLSLSLSHSVLCLVLSGWVVRRWQRVCVLSDACRASHLPGPTTRFCSSLLSFPLLLSLFLSVSCTGCVSVCLLDVNEMLLILLY